jgi:hypothetical protein
VYLVFDRYRDFSTKSGTRGAREAGASRVHHLKLKTTLPAQKVALTVTENKKKLIQLIFEELCKDMLFHTDYTKKHKLVITGEKNCPVEIQNEEIRMRHDLATNHEEADNIIVQQVLRCSLEGKSITMMSDDTDVFVLLVYYYAQAKLQVPVIMESPIKDRTVIDICETAKVNSKIVHDLLPAFGLRYRGNLLWCWKGESYQSSSGRIYLLGCSWGHHLQPRRCLQTSDSIHDGMLC